jgi:hypothetical protein
LSKARPFDFSRMALPLIYSLLHDRVVQKRITTVNSAAFDFHVRWPGVMLSRLVGGYRDCMRYRNARFPVSVGAYRRFAHRKSEAPYRSGRSNMVCRDLCARATVRL